MMSNRRCNVQACTVSDFRTFPLKVKPRHGRHGSRSEMGFNDDFMQQYSRPE